MKILFLIYHGFSNSSGISKKVHYQINAFKALGHKVFLCYYEIKADGSKARMLDNNTLDNFGKGKFASLKKICNYNSIFDFCVRENIDLIYSRSFHNANPFTIHLFHKLAERGIKSVIEIPTYPYDQEYVGFPLKERLGLVIDKLFRYQLAKYTNSIVTYSDDDNIFGKRTIKISNGIEFESIPLKKSLNLNRNEIHFIGVAEVHYWHGYDRFIQGIGEYYELGGTKKIIFHIVGGIGNSEMFNSKHAPGFQELMTKYKIKKNIIFHGEKFGKELDEIFDLCDIAVGSLARHRCNISKIKTLKNREYAARGIPFIYSETDGDFDEMPYIFKVPANETPIDIKKIIDFKENLKITSESIRNSIKALSWENQMAIVIDSLKE